MDDWAKFPRRSYYVDYEVREFVLAALAFGFAVGVVIGMIVAWYWP